MSTRILMLCILILSRVTAGTGDTLRIPASVLKDKIAGGWAGKMIGVTYGAPTEFRALGRTYEDSIRWTPANIGESSWQDDIYVQLTFMMTMDKHGIDAPMAVYQEMLAKAGFMLWHANVQTRKNYFDGILPPASGRPEFNPHADDIDFQIEADYIGLMHPAMPASASVLARSIGSIMNYGDGLYGGMFMAALYTEAYFQNDIRNIITAALGSLPSGSNYARIVRDVITLHDAYPNDWREAWAQLQAKWGKDHFCEAGWDFNIDATLNGAYIVMGLLYGEGDPYRTMEVTTRCGQDSDCNPSSAMGILGVIYGFSGLPAEMQNGVRAAADSLFVNTTYSFNTAVERTMHYAQQFAVRNGGALSDSLVTIVRQKHEAPPLEVSFPNTVVKSQSPVFDKGPWKKRGAWRTATREDWKTKRHVPHSMTADTRGSALTFTFNGSGAAIVGNWVKDGGTADIALDGKFVRTIDTYFHYSNQEHDNMVLWHVFGLPEGKHTVTVTVRGEHRKESKGSAVYITKAVVFASAPKPSAVYRFPFEH